MSRRTNWQIYLANYIDDVRALEFEWGKFDCCQFALGAEVILTGDTRWPEFIASYNSKREAYKLLAKHSDGGLFALLDTRLERIDPVLAQRGDLIGHMTPEGEGVGINDITGIWAAGADGLLLMPHKAAAAAWRL